VGPGEAAQLSFAAALAVHDAATALLPADVRIELKWPNDVLVEGRKVSGILLETAEGSDGAPATALIVGIGMNVAAPPPDAAYPATCLADHGSTAGPAEALSAVAVGLERWYARWRDRAFAPLRDAWLARARGIGAPITVRLPDASVEGLFVDLDPSGALVLDAAGGRRTIGAGDVFFRAGG
jgi:BirA family biotin operon repressor/biotin-[acetyl-CoA-carboxylase] ligase